MEDIRIRISGDPSTIKPLIDALKDIGKVDDENAQKFKKHHEEFKSQTREKEDFTERFTQGVERKMERITEYIIAAFAVERIIEWGGEAIKAFEEAEKATNDLKFAITQLNKEGDAAFSDLVEGSEKLSKSLNTLFTAKQIQQSEAQLARVKLTSEQIQQAIPRIADIAAKSGKSMDLVTEAFVKAVGEGQTRALVDFGAKFKSTGDRVNDFALIMKKTQDYTGGAADAMGTLAAQSQIASNKTEVLAENVGSKLAPAWERLKQDLLEDINAIGKIFSTTNKKITETSSKMADNAGFAQMQKNIQANGVFLKSFQQKQDQENINNKKKEVEIHKKQETDLTKLSLIALKNRLEALKDSDTLYVDEHGKTLHDIETLNTIGQEKEAARTEKEIKAREEANKKLLELYKKYQADLDSLKVQISDNQSKLDIELIKDEEDKKIAENDLYFQKQVEQFEKQREKLTEILKKGNIQERQEASDLLTQLDQEEQQTETAKQVKLQEIFDEFTKKRLDAEQKKNDQLLQLNEDAIDIETKSLQIKLRQQFDNKEITEQQYQVKSDEIDLGGLEKKLKNQEDFGKDTIKIEQDIADQKLKIQEDSAKKEEDIQKKAIEGSADFADAIIKQLNIVSDEREKSIDNQEQLVKDSISIQQGLAERGLKNDLAFELKRQSDLEAARQKEQRNIKKQKEFEAFLNAFVKFSETDPTTAPLKAAAVVAVAKGFEAAYMEHGGIIGNGEKSLINFRGFSRVHPGGGDILVHAQTGEGILSRKDISNMGGEQAFLNFKSMLNMREIPIANYSSSINTSGIERRLDSLEKTIRDKPNISIDVDGIAALIVKTTEKGVTENIRHILKRGKI